MREHSNVGTSVFYRVREGWDSYDPVWLPTTESIITVSEEELSSGTRTAHTISSEPIGDWVGIQAN